MMPNLSYQFADSSLIKKKFEMPVAPQDTTPIKLLEEVDEMNINQFIKTKQRKQTTGNNLVQENQIIDSASTPEKYDTNFYNLNNKTYSKLPIREKPVTTNRTEEPKTLFQPTTKPIGIENWQIIILFSCLFLIAFVKGVNQNRFKNMAKSIVSEQATFEIVRGEKIFFNQTNLLLNVVYLSTFSLFIFHFLYLQQKIFLFPFDFFYFLQIALFLTGVFIFQLIFNAILNFIFDTKEIQMEYIFNTSLFNNFLGVLMVPLLFLIYFTTLQNSVFFNKFILVVVFIVLLFRTIRYIKIGAKKNISNLHIFLYICTLEILPLIVIIKFFIL
ncbi:MAG: DUF4271 domain-containing protein [Vicingaceae bacterium]|nr:DUF4271 domain-containing protein [Vicingaceae bacterium]